MKYTPLAFLFLITSTVRAEEPKSDYPDLARLIHNMVVPLLPRQFEDKSSNWGMTAPLPPNLRLPRVRRTVVMVDGRLEAPEGAWKRTKVWLDDPAKALQLRVTELRPLNREKTRLVLEATIALHGERERQQWVRGLMLLNPIVQADAVIAATFEMDLAIKLTPKTFPPDISVKPKVVSTKLELKQFDLNRIGPVLLGNKEARDLGEELKGSLQDLMKQYEPEVTARLNEAIAKGLKDGQAKLSTATLLKLNLGEKN